MPHALIQALAALSLAALLAFTLVQLARIALALAPRRPLRRRRRARRRVGADAAPRAGSLPAALDPDAFWCAPDPTTARAEGSEPPVWERCAVERGWDGPWWETRPAPSAPALPELWALHGQTR